MQSRQVLKEFEVYVRKSALEAQLLELRYGFEVSYAHLKASRKARPTEFCSRICSSRIWHNGQVIGIGVACLLVEWPNPRSIIWRPATRKQCLLEHDVIDYNGRHWLCPRGYSTTKARGPP